MIQKSYSLEGSYLDVVTDWEEVLDWADLCLVPYVKLGEAGRRVATLVCRYGVRGTLSGKGRRERIRIHLARDADGYLVNGRPVEVCTDEGVIYKVDGDIIEIFYPERSEDALRDPTRLCREILYNSLPEASWFELHASAVAREGKAVVLLGGKGAGKTTSICHLLSAKDHDQLFSFVSNDRVWINIADGQTRIIGSPMPINIGYGTMVSIPELARNLFLYEDHYHVINQHWTTKAHEYSAQEFTNIFQCDICTEAVAVAVIGLQPGTSNLLMPVESDERKTEIIMSGQRASKRTYPNWMGIGKSPNERGLDGVKLSKLSCPIYEMEFTPNERAITKCDEAIISALGNLLK